MIPVQKMNYVEKDRAISEITDQFFQNQAEKKRIPGLEQPPQMGKTVSTKGQSPDKSGKPGEFRTGDTMDNTTRGQGKTDNLENNPGGIKKSVGPGSVASEQ
jgi:hypothetical protein